MYDDYDLDYTYDNARSYDLDEAYDMWVQSYALDHDIDDMDEDDYARDNDTYEALAYRHYAWYNTHVTYHALESCRHICSHRNAPYVSL